MLAMALGVNDLARHNMHATAHNAATANGSMLLAARRKTDGSPAAVA